MKALSVALVLSVLATTVPAQGDVQAFATAGARQSAGLFLWNAAKRRSPGNFNIDYTAPTWKDDHVEMIESKKAGTMRLGKDAWTSLDTNVDLHIAGTKIPAGHYYLGLHKNKDHKWSLAIFKAARIRGLRAIAFQTQYLNPDMQAPLTFNKTKKEVEKLTLKVTSESTTKATLHIHWGPYALSGAVKVILPKVKEASASGKKQQK